MQYTIRGIPGYLDSGIRGYSEKESESLSQALLDMLAAGLGFIGKHGKCELLMALLPTASAFRCVRVTNISITSSGIVRI